MSYFDEIIEKIQGGTKPENKFRWIDTKSGWNGLNREIAMKGVMKFIENSEEALNGAKRFSGKRKSCSNNKTHFTIVRKENKIWAWREEEALERFITSVNETKIQNQIIAGENHKEAIDLVLYEGNEIIEMIELKPWKSKNNPAYAFLELIKNYLLAQNDLKHVKSMTMLAPLDYYKIYFKEEKIFNEFILFVNEFNDKYSEFPHFDMKVIDISKEEFAPVFPAICRKKEPISWKMAKKTKQYACSYEYTVDGSDISEQVQDKLKYGSWKTINCHSDVS